MELWFVPGIALKQKKMCESEPDPGFLGVKGAGFSKDFQSGN